MYDKSPSLAELLAKEGLSCEKIVTGRIGYIRVENLFEKIKDARWLVFTSKNAVAGFAYNMGECELSAGVKIAVVGKKTQEEQHAVLKLILFLYKLRAWSLERV